MPLADLPKISCIVPVFNGARFLGEALESILEQTYPALEPIVVDDGSTDGTGDVARGFGDRVQYVRQDNGGPASARNRGVAESTGAFLAFLDADDIWHAEKLERQMQRFVERPDLDLSLVHQRVFWVEEMKEEQERLLRSDHPFAKDHPGYVCQAMLMPRATYDRVGPFDDTLRVGEDTEWLLRAERLGVVRELMPDVLFYRRMHQNNLSYTRYGEGAQDQLELVLRHMRIRRAASQNPEKP